MERSDEGRAKGRVRFAVIGALCAVAWTPVVKAEAGPRADRDDKVVLHDVAVRPGVTTDISFQVFVNEGHPCEGRDVLAVPGFAHTAATFKAFADAEFAQTRGQKACRIVAIDLPGHGGSGLPQGIPFGLLTLDDYVRVLQGSLERLPAHGIRPRALVAHSQGGLLVQMLQQALAAAGTSLADQFGIREATLLAPVPAAAVPWAFAAAAPAILQPLIDFNDPVLGPHVAIDDAAFEFIFCTDLTGVPVAGAPDGATVGARGYNAPEPLYGALQLVGAQPFARPDVAGGLFGPESGTSLRVIGFTQDVIIATGEAASLYQYLTGDGSGSGVIEIGGPGADHDMYLTDAPTVVGALRDR